DLEPFAAAAEALVGVAVIPVSAVPIEIELGAYELDDDGNVVETGRQAETVHVPLAHTEGSLTASPAPRASCAGTRRRRSSSRTGSSVSSVRCASGSRARTIRRSPPARS